MADLPPIEVTPGANPSQFWAGTGGALAGAGIGLLGSGIGYALGNAASNKAWQRQKNVLQKGIRWRVKDLKAAGLNPILAAGGSISGMGGGSVPMTRTSDGSAIASSASSASKIKREMDVLSMQKEAVQQQRNESNAREMTEYRKQGLLAEQMQATAIQRRLAEMSLPNAKALYDFDSSLAGQRMIQTGRAASILAGGAGNVADILKSLSVGRLYGGSLLK